MGWMVAASLLLGGGCTVEAIELEDDKPVPSALESLEASFEQISWQEGRFGAEDWRNKLPDPPMGPCECTGDSCAEEWVDSEFGCDVCVAIRCPGEAPEHVCVSC
jgi:hypothetical protein